MKFSAAFVSAALPFLAALTSALPITASPRSIITPTRPHLPQPSDGERTWKSRSAVVDGLQGSETPGLNSDGTSAASSSPSKSDTPFAVWAAAEGLDIDGTSTPSAASASASVIPTPAIRIDRKEGAINPSTSSVASASAIPTPAIHIDHKEGGISPEFAAFAAAEGLDIGKRAGIAPRIGLAGSNEDEPESSLSSSDFSPPQQSDKPLPSPVNLEDYPTLVFTLTPTMDSSLNEVNYVITGAKESPNSASSSATPSSTPSQEAISKSGDAIPSSTPCATGTQDSESSSSAPAVEASSVPSSVATPAPSTSSM